MGSKKKSDSVEIYSKTQYFAYYDLEANPNDWSNIESVTVSSMGQIVCESEGHYLDIFRDMFECFENLVSRQCNHVKDNIHYLKIVAHNGGRYDHTFLLGYLFSDKLWREGWQIANLFVVQQSALKYCRIFRECNGMTLVLEFIDTFAIFPSALWEYGKVLNIPKLEPDWTNPSQVREYRRRDVEILEKFCHTIESVMNPILGDSVFGSFDYPTFTATQLSKRLSRVIAKNNGNTYGYNNRWYPVGGNTTLWDSLAWDVSIAELKAIPWLQVHDFRGMEGQSPLRSMSLDQFSATYPNVKIGETDNSKVRGYTGLGVSRTGGLVHIRKRGHFEDVGELDVNSMYPDIMTRNLAYNFHASLKTPSLDTLFEYKRKGYAVFVMAVYDVPDLPICPIPVKVGVTYRPKGQVFTGTFQLLELAEYVLAYGGKMFPLRALVFTREPVFKDFAQFCWEKRKAYKASGDSGGAYAMKIIANAASGAAGKNPENDGFVIDEVERFGERITAKQEKTSPSVQPQTYTDITTQGQCMMLDVMYNNPDRVIYCDTDGFKFTGPAKTLNLNGLQIGSELGQLKVEYEGVRAYIADLKIYAIEKKPGDWSIKMKAIPEQVLVSKTEVSSDGSRHKTYDVDRFIKLMAGWQANGIRSVESIVAILGNVNAVRQAIPPDVWEKCPHHKRGELLHTYANTIIKNYDTLKRFIPRQLVTPKSLNHYTSPSVIWPFELPSWDKIAEAPMHETSRNHSARVFLANGYMYHCAKCGKREGININVFSGLRCVMCGSVNIKLTPVTELRTELTTLSKEYLKLCGLDKTKVTVSARTMYSYKAASDTDQDYDDSNGLG